MPGTAPTRRAGMRPLFLSSGAPPNPQLDSLWQMLLKPQGCLGTKFYELGGKFALISVTYAHKEMITCISAEVVLGVRCDPVRLIGSPCAAPGTGCCSRPKEAVTTNVSRTWLQPSFAHGIAELFSAAQQNKRF